MESVLSSALFPMNNGIRRIFSETFFCFAWSGEGCVGGCVSCEAQSGRVSTHFTQSKLKEVVG